MYVYTKEYRSKQNPPEFYSSFSVIKLMAPWVLESWV